MLLFAKKKRVEVPLNKNRAFKNPCKKLNL